MTDAPERICAWIEPNDDLESRGHFEGEWSTEGVIGETGYIRADLVPKPRVKPLVWVSCTVDGEIEDRDGSMLHPVPAIVSGQYQITRQYYNDGLWVLKTPDGKGQIASHRIADTKVRAQIHHKCFILSALE